MRSGPTKHDTGEEMRLNFDEEDKNHFSEKTKFFFKFSVLATVAFFIHFALNFV